MRTRLLVEMALTIALALVLDQLRIYRMPQGGSVSLGMLPIIVLAFRHGAIVGMTAGLLSGVLTLLTPSAYIVHPVQLLLDYPVPSALVGLAGLFRGTWLRTRAAGHNGRALWISLLPGVTVAVIARYLSHLVSGVVFFGEYAPAGQPVVLYSAIYNLYVPISGLLCLAAAAVLIPALDRHRSLSGYGART